MRRHWLTPIEKEMEKIGLRQFEYRQRMPLEDGTTYILVKTTINKTMTQKQITFQMHNTRTWNLL